jgi:acetyl-CoA carboxylase biotin carboxyl carrier protein
MKGGKPKNGSKRAAAAAGPGESTVEMARQLAAIVEAHSLSELVVDTPDLTLTLRRGGGSYDAMPSMTLSSPAPSVHHHHAAPAPAPAPRGEAAPPPAPAAAPAQPDGHVVTSPFVGTFYRSPTPDSDPYVTEGQRVEKGQVLCIVEAMKLMNEIEADKAGVIAGVLVPNGSPVEYGQPLFRIA